MVTQGHMGPYRHISAQCMISIEGYNCVSNHWPHWGTWTHRDTWAHNKQPVSGFISMYETISHKGHIDTWGNMSSQSVTSLRVYKYVSNHWPHGGTWEHTDTWVHNQQPVFEFLSMYKTIGHMEAWRHIQTRECTMYDKHWRLYLFLKPLATLGHMNTSGHTGS